MKYWDFVGFIAFLVIWYNISEAAKLRWRIMTRGGNKRYSACTERWVAVLLGAIPTICLAAWGYISLGIMIESYGEMPLAVCAWIASTGFGSFLLLRELYGALIAYHRMVKARRLGST